MTNIEFFKQQAKNLLKDYKTRYFNKDEGYYEYNPRFFSDFEDIALNFHIENKGEFTLMKAQHIIARLSGFDKWTDLIKASEPSLELGKLLLTHRIEYEKEQGYFTNLVESLIVADWKNYEKENLKDFDDASKLEVFKRVFLHEGESKKFERPTVVFDFTNHDLAQDMLVKIMKKKNLPADKAILSSITQTNCLRIIETGYASVALSLWGHDDPYREKEKLENPKVKFKLNKSKERLVALIMEKENVDFGKAVLFFMLFALEGLGYHI